MTTPHTHAHLAAVRGQPHLRSSLNGERIYLASRFARQQELREIAVELRAAGAEIVSRWLDSPAPLTATELAGRRGEAMAAQDLLDLRRATMLIAFTEPTFGTQGRGGRHVEFGVALGQGIRLVVVGPREHVFHCCPTVEHFHSWRDAREALVTQLAAAEAHG